MVEDDQPYREFEDGRLRVFGYSYDVQAVQQIATVSGHGWVSGAALMADNHLGYSMPIGGVAAYREMTSPSGVGYDIGCGVMAVRTDVAFADVADDLGRLADEIAGRISFGIGRKNPTPVDHALFDSPVWREVPELTQEVRAKRGPWSLRTRAEQQLGTVGSGNHYVDLLVEPATGELWAACHFGSRGFGHGVATGFLNLAAHRGFFSQMPGGESMHAAPGAAAADAGGRAGAGRPAAGRRRPGRDRPPVPAGDGAGRRVRLRRPRARDRPGAGDPRGGRGASACTTTTTSRGPRSTAGETVQVVRKGATPAFPGQTGFVGGSMGDWAVVVEGVESELAARTLRSTVHGAGRVMSRSRAKGNRKGTRPGVISREMMAERLRPVPARARDRRSRCAAATWTSRRSSTGGSTTSSARTRRPARSASPTGCCRVVVCMAGPDVFDPWKD